MRSGRVGLVRAVCCGRRVPGTTGLARVDGGWGLPAGSTRLCLLNCAFALCQLDCSRAIAMLVIPPRSLCPAIEVERNFQTLQLPRAPDKIRNVASQVPSTLSLCSSPVQPPSKQNMHKAASRSGSFAIFLSPFPPSYLEAKMGLWTCDFKIFICTDTSFHHILAAAGTPRFRCYVSE